MARKGGPRPGQEDPVWRQSQVPEKVTTWQFAQREAVDELSPDAQKPESQDWSPLLPEHLFSL